MSQDIGYRVSSGSVPPRVSRKLRHHDVLTVMGLMAIGISALITAYLRKLQDFWSMHSTGIMGVATLVGGMTIFFVYAIYWAKPEPDTRSHR